jgi:nucleotide-binding universal stress UspA family protein
VVDARPSAAGVEATTAHAAAHEHLVADAETALEAVRARAGAVGVPIEVEYDEGSPVAVILDRAARADLTVLGTHGRTGLGRVLLGSIAEAVVSHPVGPTLVVPPGDHPTAYRDVVVATDGSAAAERAVEHAVAVAARYDAAVHALSVVDERVSSDPGLVARLEAASEAAVRAAAARGARENVPVEMAVRAGVPSAELRAFVDERDGDLVVAGTRDAGTLDRFAVGSFTRRAVRLKLAPTLVVPPTERANEDGDE